MQSDNIKEVVTMEDQNKTKLNKFAADLPEVPRKEDGTIDLEKIAISKDDKDNYIVPDIIFDTYFRELQKGTKNASGTWRAANNGKIKILGGDPVADKEIHKAGGEAIQATLKQRRTCREILEEIARKAADAETIERLGLEQGTSNLEALNYAQYKKAQQGDTKAAEFVRDTMGEKPTEKLDASITALTAEDKELIANVERRLSAADDNG